MEPKEKAKELVEKFGGYKTKTGFTVVNIERAKQCALIHVDEIINAKTIGEGWIDKYEPYWKAVKKEIEKL